jgi:Mlc titration factor MtfA (ptsG expression regulator)
LRVESAGDRWFAAAAGALAAVAAALVGALLLGARGALGGGVLGLLAGFALRRALGLRAQRRRALLAAPFPDAWRRFLRERCDPYERIPADLRGRFEDDLRVFIAEKRITGVGIEASEELRLLVAASAVTLSLGWPDYEWDRLSEVLLYPQDFDRDYGFEMRELSGQAHGWGTVILSAPALLESFADPDDGYHVGIHEFAHLVQVDQSRFAEIPLGLGAAGSREWAELVTAETDRLRRGKSILDPYAAENPSEFLAVAVEAFFEIPLALRERHREVYALLASYFGQDTAAWDEARGLS